MFIFTLLVSVAGFWIEHVHKIVPKLCETLSHVAPKSDQHHLLEGLRELLGGSWEGLGRVPARSWEFVGCPWRPRRLWERITMDAYDI